MHITFIQLLIVARSHVHHALGRVSLLLLFLAASSVQAQVAPSENVRVELIAETTTAFAGQQLWVALRIEHEEKWHTYWKNPGDAGQPTEIYWDLPSGVTAGEIVWPVPERLVWPIGLVDFGYTDEIFLLTEISISDQFQAELLALNAGVKWLECDDTVCIQKRAEVALSLPVSSSVEIVLDERWVDDFSQTRAAIPSDELALDASFLIVDGNINLLIQATEPIFENARSISFIPDQHRVFDYTSEQVVTSQLSSMQLSQSHHRRLLEQVPGALSGVLLVHFDDQPLLAYQVEAVLGDISLAVFDGIAPVFTNVNGQQLDILLAFVYAMLGGLILNLMPCVFPILSLKVLSLVATSQSAIKQQRRHGLAYTAGVIAAFLVLASILVALQAGGALIGWGFQLQAPWFVAGLACLFFILALAMSSFIEVGSSLMGVGTKLADKDGYLGSFYTGLLASVVGSPCTVPFIGPALAFALTQSVVITLAVFVALGLGMALPFLVISYTPALARLLPKPGKWMLTFKKVLAVPLYLTVLWLLWVLEKQVSPIALLMVVVSGVLLGLSAWLYQGLKQCSQGVFASTNIVSSCVIVLTLVGVLGLFASPVLRSGQGATGLAIEEGVEVYSDARLSELRSNNTPVFVNMTAAWCITCLVNERVALESEEVKEALETNGVVYLKGDWTNNDPEITAVLKRYQTSGVPLYLMFSADSSLPAKILPQILTESIMVNAIIEAAQN